MKNILNNSVPFNSVTQSCLTLHPHGLQHARPPYPSPTPGVYSNSCPLSQRCYLTISSFAALFTFHLQSSPASGSFLRSWLFTSDSQSIGASATASVLPMNIQDWFPLGLPGWISLLSKGLSRVFCNMTVQSINSSVLSFLYSPILTSIYDYWKKHRFDYIDLCWQYDVFCFLICCLGWS